MEESEEDRVTEFLSHLEFTGVPTGKRRLSLLLYGVSDFFSPVDDIDFLLPNETWERRCGYLLRLEKQLQRELVEIQQSAMELLPTELALEVLQAHSIASNLWPISHVDILRHSDGATPKIVAQLLMLDVNRCQPQLQERFQQLGAKIEALCVMEESQRPSVQTRGREDAGFLGLIVNAVDQTIRREGYGHIPAINLSRADAQWHTFYVAFRAGENGATDAQWLNGYPGDEEASRRRSVKRTLREKLQSLGLTLADGEGVRLIEWNGT